NTRILLAQPQPGVLKEPADKPTATHNVELHTISEKRGPGWSSSMYFGKEPLPEVAYTEMFSQNLMLARHKNNKWRSARLLKHVGAASGAVSDAGDWVIAVQGVKTLDNSPNTLQYLRRKPGQEKWQRYFIDPQGPLGPYMDTAISPNGRLVIAYYSERIKGLKLYIEAL